MDLTNCIPKDKHDTAAIERAGSIGFPMINPILSDLLEWVQDSNWQVADGTASLLSRAGPEILPHIRKVLNSEDEIWKFWTIELVVRNLKPEYLTALQDELVRLANDPTYEEKLEEVDVAARALLTT